MSDKLGVMLCGHGSRDRTAIREFATLAGRLTEKLPAYHVDYGYLEFATPIIRDGLNALKAKGVTNILAIPGMLFAAGHAKNDIPSVLNNYQKHNEIKIQYGRELGIDPKMLKAASERIEEAISKARQHISKHETCIVVVGRGASDPDANSNVSKVMRMIWEGMGFGWGEVAYSGVTFPLVEPALNHIVNLGFKRVVVFPYFLFSGVLVRRIYAYTDKVAARNPEIEFIKAPYLNDHPSVVETFIDRIHEAMHGTGNMNCQMCKYRNQVLGFESEVGLPQESHHHHVEGIGGNQPSHDDFDRKHEHNHSIQNHQHGHTHHPYPHTDHPLGPKSMSDDKNH